MTAPQPPAGSPVPPDAPAVEALIDAVAGAFGTGAVPESARRLVPMLREPAPAVAIVGLFNRGKSTLFNRLVGAPVSPVSWEPETTALIVARTGAARATGSGPSGPVTLPSDPGLLSPRLRREAGARFDRVEVSGPFRLPAGAALVDTPGLAEPAGVGAVDWAGAGVHGAVVVVGWPPGAARQDVELFAAARDVFAGNVAVVVNPVVGGVDDPTLARVAARAAEATGVPVGIVPGPDPAGPWGADPAWADLEATLGGLWGDRPAVIARTWGDVTRACDALAAQLTERAWTVADAGALEAVAALAPLAPGLAAAASAALEAVRAGGAVPARTPVRAEGPPAVVTSGADEARVASLVTAARAALTEVAGLAGTPGAERPGVDGTSPLERAGAEATARWGEITALAARSPTAARAVAELLAEPTARLVCPDVPAALAGLPAAWRAPALARARGWLTVPELITIHGACPELAGDVEDELAARGENDLLARLRAGEPAGDVLAGARRRWADRWRRASAMHGWGWAAILAGWILLVVPQVGLPLVGGGVWAVVVARRRRRELAGEAPDRYAERWRWKRIHWWSFVLWGVSFAMLMGSIVAAFLMWAVSFTMWLVSREQLAELDRADRTADPADPDGEASPSPPQAAAPPPPPPGAHPTCPPPPGAQATSPPPPPAPGPGTSAGDVGPGRGGPPPGGGRR